MHNQTIWLFESPGQGSAGSAHGTARLSLPAVLDAATSDIASRLGADGPILYLYDEQAGSFAVIRSLAVPDDGADGEAPPAVQEVLLDVLSGEEPRVADAWNLGPKGSDAGAEALLLPLVAKRPIGVVAVARRGDPTRPEVLAAGRSAATRIEVSLAGYDEGNDFQRALEAEQTGIAVVEGPAHVICYASPHVREALGLVTVPLLGRPLRDVLPAQIYARVLPSLDAVRASRQPAREERTEWLDEYGARYFAYQVIPGGHPDALIIAVRPRTDTIVTRQALETSIVALADSQRTLAAVLNNTNNGIFFIGPDLEVLYANRRMGEMFGIDVRTTIGRNKRQVVRSDIMPHMEDPEGFAQRLSHLYDHMEEVAADEVVVAHPVRRILDRYSAPVYKEDGSVLGRIEVYSDVTEIRELQRNKDEFLSLVSHELRTPVTSIKGYAQLLRRRASQQPVTRQTAAAYETIERQTSRMQELIDTLLDLSRLETGRLQLRIGEVDFTRLVAHVVEMIRMTSEDREVVLRGANGPLWVQGDERRLEQIMTNLLTNAVRYSAPGTTIVVDVAMEHGTVRASVNDEGIGILPEARDRVFERFFRAEGVRESTGLGIGLYITKRFVEEHGGTIEVQSEVGVGSTFTVRLPGREQRGRLSRI